MKQAWADAEDSPAGISSSEEPPMRQVLDLPQRTRDWDLERDHPFSWFHCLVSVVSYVLMLSDVPRTGFGVQNLQSYKTLEPDHLIFFGPYAYPLTKELLRNETGSMTTAVPFWPYKYDSTSLTMRALATHLSVPQWPSCLTYSSKCEERTGIPRDTIFTMIDSLIDAIKDHKDTSEPRERTGRITLRIAYAWYDRLHDYAFPFFFSMPRYRTVQATHYDFMLSATSRLNSTCGSPHKNDRSLTCEESWTNFERLCTSKSALCDNVGTVHAHIPSRLYQLATKYPNHTVDAVVLEGVDGFTRSSLTFQGSKFVDIVTLARVRKCSTDGSTECETIVVDDFRYEMASFMTNVPHWFGITAAIRGLGQCYAWTRLLFLLVGCYAARADEPRMQQRSLVGRAVLTVRTVFLLPSQVMVYGSLFPISCYLLAHLIDSAAVYELMGQKFYTLMGVISLEFGELVRVCAVSMRSLWLLAFICHALHWIATRCAWSPIHGVPGIPEFSLAFVASMTILAQARHPSLRSCGVLSIVELATSPARHRWQSDHSDSSHGFLYKLFFGTVIDYKCLAVSLALHIALVLIVRVVNRVFPRCVKYQLMVTTRTVVLYAADLFWPTSSLVVSWNGTFLAKPLPKAARPVSSKALSVVVQSYDERHPSSINAVAPFSTRRITLNSKRRLDLTAASERRLMFLHLNSTRGNDHVETLIYLMNLGVMTDPLTFLRLRVLRGALIGVYRSRYTQRCILLPLTLSTSSVNDISIDWSDLELQFVVRTRELGWCELLQCG